MALSVSKKILIVEDDKDIQDLVKMYLDKEGFRTRTARDGAEALREIRSGHVDLMILDLMIPKVDGLEVCKTVRQSPNISTLPIVMLTAKNDESDMVIGLELGADDYVTKPFSPSGLVARIKSVFRRIERAKDFEISSYQYGSLCLSLCRHEVTVEGREVKLTCKEFGVLEQLLKNRGRVLTRDMLLNNIWGYDYHGTTRTVDVHVRRIKQKLPVLNNAIESIKSIGYKLREQNLIS